MQEPSVAIPIVVAIAIHNIPEGIAVSVPIYQATGSQNESFYILFIRFGRTYRRVNWLVHFNADYE